MYLFSVALRYLASWKQTIKEMVVCDGGSSFCNLNKASYCGFKVLDVNYSMDNFSVTC